RFPVPYLCVKVGSCQEYGSVRSIGLCRSRTELAAVPDYALLLQRLQVVRVNSEQPAQDFRRMAAQRGRRVPVLDGCIAELDGVGYVAHHALARVARYGNGYVPMHHLRMVEDLAVAVDAAMRDIVLRERGKPVIGRLSGDISLNTAYQRLAILYSPLRIFVFFVGGEIRALDRLAEAQPLLFIAHGDNDLSVERIKHLI